MINAVCRLDETGDQSNRAKTPSAKPESHLLVCTWKTQQQQNQASGLVFLTRATWWVKNLPFSCKQWGRSTSPSLPWGRTSGNQLDPYRES